MTFDPDPTNKFITSLNTFIDQLRVGIRSYFSSDPLLKGIVILGSGTAISQVLRIIFIPIITRIYEPAIYGTLAVFISILSILVVAGTLRYELTLPIAEKDEDAQYLLILSFLIVCILTLILFMILGLWGDYLAGIVNLEFITPYYWLFCVGFLGASLYQILTYWTLRSKDYITITRTSIAQSLSGSVTKIILGMLSFGSFGLICGDIIGRMAGLGTLGRKIVPEMWIKIHHIDVHRLWSLAYRFRKFPLFSLPASIINELSLQLPTLFLSAIFGFQIVGLYSLSYSISVLPVSYISGSIAYAYSAESSELFRQKSGTLLALYQKTTKKLFLFGAPLILIGAVISPVIFPIIFGSAWKDAGLFVLPLSIMIIAQFVVGSTDRLELYGYNHWELAWNICRTSMVLVGFYLALLFGLSPLATILIFSCLMTIMYAVCYILNIKAIQRVVKEMK